MIAEAFDLALLIGTSFWAFVVLIIVAGVIIFGPIYLLLEFILPTTINALVALREKIRK